jgi:hypothetical protein
LALDHVGVRGLAREESVGMTAYEVVRVDRYGVPHLVGRFVDCAHPFEALMRAGCDLLVRDVNTGQWCWDLTYLAREAALSKNLHGGEAQGEEKHL